LIIHNHRRHEGQSKGQCEVWSGEIKKGRCPTKV
jgi:hypothetical protein